MSVPILDFLHKTIKDKPKMQVIHLTERQAKEYHEYLMEYHLLPPPPLEQIESLKFLGRSINVQETETV